MIEVLTQAAILDFRARIGRAGRNHADVDLHLLAATHALEILLDENAQDLALRLKRHVRRFVEEQRAAMGLFEQAHLATAFTRTLNAEEFDLHAFRRN